MIQLARWLCLQVLASSGDGLATFYFDRSVLMIRGAYRSWAMDLWHVTQMIDLGTNNRPSLRLCLCRWARLESRHNSGWSCRKCNTHGVALALGQAGWRRLSQGCYIGSMCPLNDFRDVAHTLLKRSRFVVLVEFDYLQRWIKNVLTQFLFNS